MSTKKKNLSVYLTAFALFAAGCFYVTASSVVEFGTGGNKLDVGHISPLELKEDSR